MAANNRPLDFAYEVVGQCEVSQAFDKACRLLVTGTSSASFLNEKLQVDPFFLGDVTDLHAMDAYPK